MWHILAQTTPDVGPSDQRLVAPMLLVVASVVFLVCWIATRRRRGRALVDLAEQFGIEPGRVRLEWVSASEGELFAQVVTEFTEQLQELEFSAG